MPISVVNTTKKGQAAGTSTGNTPAISTTTGNTLVAVLIVPDTISIAISDSASNSWGSPIVNGTTLPASGRLYVWECVNATGSASHTFSASWGGGSTAATLLIAEIGGVATVSARDGSAVSQNDPTGDFVSPNLTTANATDLLVAIIGADSVTNPSTISISSATPSGGWTIDVKEEDLSLYWPAAIATQRVTSTGTYNAGFAVAGGNGAAVALVAYKEAAGGSSTTPISILNPHVLGFAPGVGNF